MSKAKYLADKCGAIFDENTNLFVLDDLELEVFYHAARAEALMDAADFLGFRDLVWSGVDVKASLRAMADREGKQ